MRDCCSVEYCGRDWERQTSGSEPGLWDREGAGLIEGLEVGGQIGFGWLVGWWVGGERGRTGSRGRCFWRPLHGFGTVFPSWVQLGLVLLSRGIRERCMPGGPLEMGEEGGVGMSACESVSVVFLFPAGSVWAWEGEGRCQKHGDGVLR